MQNLLCLWKGRNLSMKAKITVINYMALSPLLHLASAIYVPSSAISEVKQLVLTSSGMAKHQNWHMMF